LLPLGTNYIACGLRGYARQYTHINLPAFYTVLRYRAIMLQRSLRCRAINGLCSGRPSNDSRSDPLLNRCLLLDNNWI